MGVAIYRNILVHVATFTMYMYMIVAAEYTFSVLCLLFLCPNYVNHKCNRRVTSDCEITKVGIEIGHRLSCRVLQQ